MIKNYLRLKLEHENNRIKISLLFDGDCIDFDFIDYSEIVHVVHRLNDGKYQ